MVSFTDNLISVYHLTSIGKSDLVKTAGVPSLNGHNFYQMRRKLSAYRRPATERCIGAYYDPSMKAEGLTSL